MSQIFGGGKMFKVIILGVKISVVKRFRGQNFGGPNFKEVQNYLGQKLVGSQFWEGLNYGVHILGRD